MIPEGKVRVEFEHVSAIAHPDCYQDERPCVRVDDVPEHYWSKVSVEKDRDLGEQQFQGLRELEAAGELIRRPMLTVPRTAEVPEVPADRAGAARGPGGMSARQPAARHPQPLEVALPPAVVEQVDFWTGTGRFATGSGCTEWVGHRAGDGKPVLVLVAKDDPLSPSVQVRLQLRDRVTDRVTEFAQYLAGWSAEHMPLVSEHEIQSMRTAARELLRIVGEVDDAA